MISHHADTNVMFWSKLVITYLTNMVLHFDMNMNCLHMLCLKYSWQKIHSHCHIGSAFLRRDPTFSGSLAHPLTSRPTQSDRSPAQVVKSVVKEWNRGRQQASADCPLRASVVFLKSPRVSVLCHPSCCRERRRTQRRQATCATCLQSITSLALQPSSIIMPMHRKSNPQQHFCPFEVEVA